MPRKSLPVVLSESEITRLEQWIRAGSTPQQVVLRAKIILNIAGGQSDQRIARELKVQRRIKNQKSKLCRGAESL